MFYKLSWNLQLLATLLLFSVSLLIQVSIFADFMSSFIIALLITAGLELSKGLSIILYRHFKTNHSSNYPFSVRFLTLVFRLGLIFLSLFSSIMYLGHFFDRPNIEKIRSVDLQNIELNYQEQKARLIKAFENNIQLQRKLKKETFNQQILSLEKQYLPEISQLKNQLNDEMNNVINGSFDGPRYKEFKRRLDTANQQYESSKINLTNQHHRSVAKLNVDLTRSHQAQLQSLNAVYASDISHIQNHQYQDDLRVKDPRTTSVLLLINHLFSVHITSLDLALLISILMSLLIEIGILVGIENATLTYLPIFFAEELAQQEIEKHKIDTDAELSKFKQKDSVTRSKVSTQSDSISEQAEHFARSY